ncbi:D-alanine--D-alanine ligase [Lutibacter sp. A64]|uniref:D-alanine--D-alanine ligase n=1 Tax=Lutibacter sp. A64 TaxID=2918526 RepID=UPI001F066A1F|nr:D-alanine--D-alanine ligase [Lutibacter sp. A64]UMB54268.1 D-alanine--D-alanine ligase [Lutibacter sp. A64]
MKVHNFKKSLQWEYWPSYLFYVPVVPYAFYLALKSRSFGFFSAVNPSIEGSGNGLESKFKTIELVPDTYKPKSMFVAKNQKLEEILNNLKQKNIEFPLIIKPDIGFRGLLVKKINTEIELQNYLKKYNTINLIIQEFISYKNECGIFYHRIPNEAKGKITSITLKKFLAVTGDGTSNLSTLIKNNERATNYLDLVLALNTDKLKSIPKKGEKIILTVIGNHSKGTEFINGNHLITKKLEKTLDTINSSINGWYYGRIDVKFKNFEELLQGKNLKILEINGVIAEPTHIYDASKGTYYKALKSIKEHWKIIYKIGVKNKQLNNGNFTNLKYLINVYFKYKKYLKTVKKLAAN